MILMYKILPISLLLDVCSSMRNFHIPHGGHLHHSDLPMQRDNNYQHYDSYSSEEVVLRQSPRRDKYHRHMEYSDSEYKNKCECSCIKCQTRKPKPNSCCEEFCATECAVQHNIVVVPYPVPFMIFNQSAQDFAPPMPTQPPTTSSSTTTTTTTTTERTTITEITTTTKKDEVTISTDANYETDTGVTFTKDPYFDTKHDMTFSTVPYLDIKPYKPFKRFHIVDEKNLRRNNRPKEVLRSPKFGRLPKYGIVPIPENLALSLMQQIRKDQSNDQLRNRLALNKNLLDYTRKSIA